MSTEERLRQLELRAEIHKQVIKEILGQFCSPVGDVTTVYEKIEQRVLTNILKERNC